MSELERKAKEVRTLIATDMEDNIKNSRTECH